MATSRQLTRLADKEIYTPQEFENGTRMERIMMHMVSPHQHALLEEELNYLTSIRMCWSIYCATLHDGMRYMMIMDAFPDITDKSIEQLIGDMQFLYGQFNEVDRDTQRAIDRQLLTELINEARGKGDYKSVASFTKQLLALNGTDQPRDVRKKPNDDKLPDVVHLDDDTKLLDRDGSEEE